MRLENGLLQWASEMTVCADTMADIFPAHQSASNRRRSIKEDKKQ